ncbi:MAG: hypothetical protein KC491_01180 [Dehalococcoidia bacterium]|nr:hypothetical protein [Dehalococcoidia bacterium]
MTRPERVSADGHLPEAKTRLTNAISAVFAPIIQSRDGTHHAAPSLWTQLCESVAGQTGERSGSKAGMPLWVDVLDLKNAIITQLADWEPTRVATINKVDLIETRGWRPQDCERIHTIAATMESWAVSIEALLRPERHWTLPNPCPACGVRTVYRTVAGEEVRCPALQIGASGCTCIRCHTVWPPQQFEWLARLLGYEPHTALTGS